MVNTVKLRLQSVELGSAQVYKNIAILPLLAPTEGKFQYQTLADALASGLSISEVSAAGSVPELLVNNRSRSPVLLIDGEELAGAKQNRVLNTSILLKPECDTKIPVSCTEQGRWSYASAQFIESGNVMAYKSRSRKVRSVHESLESAYGHHSDQAEVWQGIAALQCKAETQSPTSAMSDVYRALEQDLRSCDDLFACLSNQAGFIAFLDGVAVGLDLVSLPGAYAKIHRKLVRSYTVEALLETRTAPKGRDAGGTFPGAAAETSQPAALKARACQFLADIMELEERQFASVGLGTDFRYRSQHTGTEPGLTGSALVHEDELIHGAFFRLEEPASEPRARRGWRRSGSGAGDEPSS